MSNEQIIAKHQATIASMAASLARLTEQNAQLLEKVEELTAMLAKKKRPRRKPAVVEKSEVEASEIATRPTPPELPERDKSEPKTGYQTGRKPLPEELEVEEETLRPDTCGHCGGAELRIVDQVVAEKLTIVKQHTRTKRWIRKTCECTHCLRRTTAKAPPAPYPRSKVTSEFLAWLVYQKYGLHLPLDRIRRELADQGVDLAMSFLVKLIERGAGLLEGVDGVHWKQLLGGSHMHTDGSGLPVVVPGAGTHRGVVDVFAWDDIAVYQYSTGKDGQELVAKLRPFAGTLVADAESRLNAIYTQLDVTEAGCNAHGRRKFRVAEAVQPELAEEAGRFLSAVYIKEREARENGLEGDALLAWRQTEEKPIIEDFKVWLDIMEPKLLPKDPLGKAVRYARNHWAALTRFLDDPALPPDNNLSERLLRPLALGRNNWVFAGSTEGAHRATVLMGIIATCRLSGVDPMAYMTWAFDRLGTRRKPDGHTAIGSTPAAFKQASE